MGKGQSFSYACDKVRLSRCMGEMKKKQHASKRINQSDSDFADYLYKIMDSEMSSFVGNYRKTRGGRH